MRAGGSALHSGTSPVATERASSTRCIVAAVTLPNRPRSRRLSMERNCIWNTTTL